MGCLMRCKLIYLILLISSIGFSSEYEIGEIPSWVEIREIPVETIPVHPSQVNVQCLLLDTQINLEEKTDFFHGAWRILGQAGAEAFNQLSFSFDPSLSQRLTLHKIRIFRDGVWTDRLYTSEHKIIDQQPENNIYTGGVRLTYFLDDIRPGDIVDVQRSAHGLSALFAHYEDCMALQREESIEQIFCRILAHPQSGLAFLPINTSISPCVRRLSPELTEWTWEVCNTAPYPQENHVPMWYDAKAQMQVSEYRSWQEAADEVVPFYAPRTEGFSAEMLRLVEEWKSATNDPLERAHLALRFVQDQVSYLALSEGGRGWKPEDPNLVLEKRFGDCKAKTFLLQTLLSLMDIASTPVLVDTREGPNLNRLLPMQRFNHVVLRIEIQGAHYFVETTASSQGGSLQNTYFPNYSWGLPICENSPGLIALPEDHPERPTEIEANVLFTSPTDVELQIHITKYGAFADAMRYNLEQTGLQKLAKNEIDALQNMYGKVVVLNPLTVADDRAANIFQTSASYQLPLRSRREKKVLKILSQIRTEYLDRGVQIDRASPYALRYPLWVKEHLHIYNPFHIPKSDQSFTSQNESVLYRYDYRTEGDTVDIQYELKTQKDHIPADAAHEYWDLIDEIDAIHIGEIEWVTPPQ